MPVNRYSHLLESEPPPELFVRSGLGLLEAGFREMALLALHDWAERGIVSDELFAAVASLQRPSWGMWNGLIAALRNARKTTIRAGDSGQRQRLEEAKVLEKVLGMMEVVVDPSVAGSLKPMGELTRTPVGSKLKLGAILTMPIGLRNRVAHDTPTDAGWWERAATALRPLIEYHAAADPMRVRRIGLEYPSPWFFMDGEEALSFNGVEHDFAVLYVNDAGVSRAVPERSGEVLRAFQQLLGKVDEQEKDFKKILSRLAPEEIKGVMLGDYLVGKPVGEGGFATVHVGRQLSTGRKVAIKILHDGMEPEAMARFQQEAAFLSRFRHPNIVDVYGFGQEAWSAPRAFSLEGEPWFDAFSKTAPVKTFIALEWIDGRTLDDVFRAAEKSPERKPGLQTLARWMAASADALSVVHAAGLIHRDIKPLNLMVTNDGLAPDAKESEGQIKLMDFGIARVLKAERTLMTESGRAMGTPAYMSPEQIRAADSEGEVGPASDVYSLAATFYELVTGSRLYHHDTATAEEVKTMKVTGRRPVRPKLVVNGLPWEIETILLGGLEPEAADRYRSMEALERDVRHFLADEPIEYKQPSLARRGLLVYRRNRAVSNLVALFLILAIGGIAGYIKSIRAAEHRTAVQRDIAVHNETIAREQRTLAEAREKESRLRLAELSSNNGHALMDRGDPTGALLWYVHSLPLVADVPSRDRIERLRIGMTLRQMPRPVSMWNYPLKLRQAVYAATLSIDGRRIATAEVWNSKGSADLADTVGLTRVFDSRTGRELFPAIEHAKMASSIRFSHDGKRLVTLSGGGQAQVFDAETGKPLYPPLIDPAGIAQVKFSFDGRLLLIVSGSMKALRIFDLEKGGPLYPDLTFDQTVASAEFADDGKHFLAATVHGAAHTDEVIRIYDVATGNPTMPSLNVATLWNVVFSPGGGTFAVASGEGWGRVYDSASGEPITPPLAHSGAVIQVRFSYDGKQIATGSADKTARIWDAVTGKAITAPMQHEESPFAMGFSPDGSRLATIAYDKALRIWDAKSGYRIAPSLRQTAEIVDGLFMPEAGNQFVIVTQAGAVWWDFNRSADPGIAKFDQELEATRATISHDGSRVALNGSKGGVRLIDPATGKALGTPLQHPQAVENVRFSPDDQRLATAAIDGARVWDVSTAVATTQPTPTPKIVVTIKHQGAVHTAKFNANGQWLVTASADKTARVWNASTGEPIAPALQHAGEVNDAEFSPDGMSVATASQDGNARVWEAATGKPLTEPLRSGSGVSQVHFSPDGKLLLVPDDQGYLRLWDWRAGESLTRMKYGTSTREAAFSRDGTKILAAGYNDMVKLFATQSPQKPMSVLLSGPFSAFACFAPDGSTVYTASFAGSRLWDVGGSPLGPPMQPAPLRYGEFTPDGRRLVTVDTKVRTWDVTPDSRPAAELEKFAKLLSSRVLDGTGVLSQLSESESMALFDELRAKYPEEFSGSGGHSTTRP